MVVINIPRRQLTSDSRSLQWPADVEVRSGTFGDPESSIAHIAFYPSGNSSGGTIVLTRARQTSRVVTDPFDGLSAVVR